MALTVDLCGVVVISLEAELEVVLVVEPAVEVVQVYRVLPTSRRPVRILRHLTVRYELVEASDGLRL